MSVIKAELSEEEFNRFFKKTEPLQKGERPVQYDEPIDLTNLGEDAYNKIIKDLKEEGKDIDGDKIKREKDNRDRKRKEEDTKFVKDLKTKREKAREERRKKLKEKAEEEKKEMEKRREEFKTKFENIYKMIRAVNSESIRDSATGSNVNNESVLGGNLEEMAERNTINQGDLEKSRELLREAEKYFRENKEKIDELFTSMGERITNIGVVDVKYEEDVFNKKLRLEYGEFEKFIAELRQIFQKSSKKYSQVCQKMNFALDDLLVNFTKYVEFSGVDGKISRNEKETAELKRAVSASVKAINEKSGGDKKDKEVVLSDALDGVLSIDYDDSDFNKLRSERYVFNDKSKKLKKIQEELIILYSELLEKYNVIVSMSRNVTEELNGITFLIKIFDGYFNKFGDIITKLENSTLNLEDYEERLREIFNSVHGFFNSLPGDWNDFDFVSEEFVIPVIDYSNRILNLSRDLLIYYNESREKYIQENENKFSVDFANGQGGNIPTVFRKGLGEQKEYDMRGKSAERKNIIQNEYDIKIEQVNLLETTKKIKDLEEKLKDLEKEKQDLNDIKEAISRERNILRNLCGRKEGAPIPPSKESQLETQLEGEKGKVKGLETEVSQAEDRTDRANRDRDAALATAQRDEAALRNARAEAATARGEAATARGEVLSVRTELQEKLDEISSMRARLAWYYNEFKAADTHITKLENEIRILNASEQSSSVYIQRLNEELVRHEEINSSLRRDITELITTHQGRVQVLRERIGELEREGRLSEETAEETRTNLEEEVRRREEIERELFGVSEEKGDAVSRERAAQEKVARLTQENREQNERLSEALSEGERQSLERISRVKQETSQQLEEARADHETEVARLEQSNTASKGEFENAKQRMEVELLDVRRGKDEADSLALTLKNKLGERESERNDALAELEEKERERRELAERLSRGDVEKRQLEEQLAQKETERQNLEREKEELFSNSSSEIDELKAVIERKRLEGIESSEENRRLSDLERNNIAEKQRLETQIREINREKSNIKGRLRDSESERQRVSRRLGVSEREKEGLRQRLGVSEREKEGLRQRLGVSEREKEELRLGLGVSEGEKEELRLGLGVSEGEKEELRQRLEASTREIALTEQTNNNLLQINRRIQSELDSRSNLTLDEVEELNRQIRENNQRIDSLEERLEREVHFRGVLEDAVLEKERERDEARETIEEREGELGEARETIEERERERDEARRVLGEREGELGEVRRVLGEREREKEDYRELLVKASKSIKKSREHEEVYQDTISMLTDERDNHSKRIKVLERRINNLKTLIVRKIDEEKIADEKYLEFIRERDEKLELEKIKNQQLEKKNQQLEEENQQLEEEVDTLIGELNSPLKLQRSKHLSPTSKIKNVRNKRMERINNMKYKK